MFVYLAAPLFSDAEKTFNRSLKEQIESKYDDVFLHLPQEYGDNIERRMDSAKSIFVNNRRNLAAADLIIAVVDGSDVDSGTAWEVGWAYAKNIPIVALRTDFRRCAIDESYNLMIEQCVDRRIPSVIDLKKLNLRYWCMIKAFRNQLSEYGIRPKTWIEISNTLDSEIFAKVAEFMSQQYITPQEVVDITLNRYWTIADLKEKYIKEVLEKNSGKAFFLIKDMCIYHCISKCNELFKAHMGNYINFLEPYYINKGISIEDDKFH